MFALPLILVVQSHTDTLIFRVITVLSRQLMLSMEMPQIRQEDRRQTTDNDDMFTFRQTGYCQVSDRVVALCLSPRPEV